MSRLSKKLQILLVLTVVTILLVLRFTGILGFFSIENLKHYRMDLLQFVTNHYLLSVLLYILLYILVVATTLPLAAFMTVVGGFLFGMIHGIFYVNIGATIGAVISFLWMRQLFAHTIPTRFKEKLATFNHSIKEHGALYLLGLHLMSLLPFFVINALAVLANTAFFTFVWTTSIGIIPISILYTYMGQRLGTLNSINEVLTVPIMLIFLALALLAILPIIFVKMKQRKNTI